MNKALKKFIPKLVLYSAAVGILVGVLELFIGHRFILDPLLYGKDLGFVYESYFEPTYYGLTKTIITGITFFLVYLFMFKKKLKPIIKSSIVGVLGTAIFGIYYYFTFPSVASFSSVPIAIVHFTFIAGISYAVSKIAKIK